MAPELDHIKPKINVNNEKFFNGEVMIEDIWNVLSFNEMKSMAGMLRYVFDQAAILALKQSPLPEDVEVESVCANGVNLEWQIVPDADEERVLLFLHGGGMIYGSSLSHCIFTSALGQATKMRVLNVNYRLSPEARFPTALEDCMMTYNWLIDRGIKPENIVIAGDSAGGNLTLATILNLRDKGISMPKGAVCFCPLTSYLQSDWNLDKAETDPILSDVGLFWWVVAYLGQKNPVSPLDPLVSPLLGDLQGFPPVLVQATTPEIFFDQCELFIEKAKSAGVDATFQAWDGLFHDWQSFALGVLPEAQEAIDKVGLWIEKLFI